MPLIISEVALVDAVDAPSTAGIGTEALTKMFKRLWRQEGRTGGLK